MTNAKDNNQVDPLTDVAANIPDMILEDLSEIKSLSREDFDARVPKDQEPKAKIIFKAYDVEQEASVEIEGRADLLMAGAYSILMSLVKNRQVAKAMPMIFENVMESIDKQEPNAEDLLLEALDKAIGSLRSAMNGVSEDELDAMCDLASDVENLRRSNSKNNETGSCVLDGDGTVQSMNVEQETDNMDKQNNNIAGDPLVAEKQ